MARLMTVALLTASALSAQTPGRTPAPVAAPAAKPTATTAPALPNSKPDPWAALRFLLGSWEVKTTGGVAQAQAAAGYTFRLELRDHVLVRHSRSGACMSPEDLDCQHNDLLTIYASGAGAAMEALYLDNEGHVIHYSISTPKPNAVLLLSDPSQPGPQYRLSYELDDKVMNGRIEVKEPGAADFSSYLEWSGHQR
jgi:hypothetical protein